MAEALRTSDIGSLPIRQPGEKSGRAEQWGLPPQKMREVSPMCPVQSVINVATRFFEVSVRRSLKYCCTTIFPNGGAWFRCP
jgi:hypothetical protein